MSDWSMLHPYNAPVPQYSQPKSYEHYFHTPTSSNLLTSTNDITKSAHVEPCNSGNGEDSSRVQTHSCDAHSPVSSTLHDGKAGFIQESEQFTPYSAHQHGSHLVENNALLPFPKAAGHGGMKLDPKDPARLVKETFAKEAFFYQSLAPKLDKTLENLWDGWRPHYYGSKELPGSKNGKPLASIILENIANAKSSQNHDRDSELFWHPNVIDIKLGKILTSESEETEKMKRKARIAKNTTSGTFGMRLTGAQLWDNVNEKYIKVNKQYGHSVDVSGSNLQEKFNALFPLFIGEGKKIEASLLTSSPGGLTPKMMQVVLESVISQLDKVLKHVSHLKWRSRTTSVLIVFEGDARRLEKVVESDGQIKAKLSAVKLIDFPYAEEHDQVDKGLILGLQNTLKHFQELYKTIDNFQKQ